MDPEGSQWFGGSSFSEGGDSPREVIQRDISPGEGSEGRGKEGDDPPKPRGEEEGDI
jgi:hypothetical protein